MEKGFKEAAARSKPVYGTLMGSAQPAEQTPAIQEVHSTQGRKGAKQH